MRLSRSSWLLPFIFMILAGCAAEKPAAPADAKDDADAQSIEEKRAEALAKIDVEACKAGGGEVRQEGMLGLPRCVTPYADAGTTCRDGDDCFGRCLGDDATTNYDAPPGELVGLCEADDSPFGCYDEIEDGRSTGFICVD
ncbi:MAG: hypothetical protein WD076_03750 [Parvularculaceae bacterium]